MSILDRFRLTGKRLFITGGSRGLGREMALAIADAGADCILVGREAESLEKTAAEIRALGRQAFTITADVSKTSECEAACHRALELGPIDILINNAGGRRQNVATEEMSLEMWRELMDLNLTSTFLCTKLIGGAMLKRGARVPPAGSSASGVGVSPSRGGDPPAGSADRGAVVPPSRGAGVSPAKNAGRIINIASINALVAGRKIAGRHYETSKAAVVNFTRATAADWAPYGITVNAILPGGFMTDANLRWKSIHPDVIEAFEQQIPMGRYGEPWELGPLAVYLASDASAYMTGASLVIDGGYTLW
jgi:NAD(P)-dependent dehydrogenase (short-subunit alcohol dehydrogenase family)